MPDGEGVRIRVVGDQVPAAELRRIHAELLRGEVDDAFGQRHRDRMADGAVLAGDVLVGEHDVAACARYFWCLYGPPVRFTTWLPSMPLVRG